MVNEQLVLFQRRASKTQIRKFLGSFSYKFLRCASLQIANPQIFLMNLQMFKFLQILHNSVAKQHFMIYCIFKEKKFVFLDFSVVLNP